MSQINSTDTAKFLALYKEQKGYEKENSNSDFELFEEALRSSIESFTKNSRLLSSGKQIVANSSEELNIETDKNNFDTKTPKANNSEINSQKDVPYNSETSKIRQIHCAKTFLVRPDLIIPLFEKEITKEKKKTSKRPSEKYFQNDDKTEEKYQNQDQQ